MLSYTTVHTFVVGKIYNVLEKKSLLLNKRFYRVIEARWTSHRDVFVAGFAVLMQNVCVRHTGTLMDADMESRVV